MQKYFLLMTRTENLNSEFYEKQIKLISAGQKELNIVRPATPSDGISLIDDHSEYLELYKSAVMTGRIMKFVPSSGAATRMAKSLLRISKKFKSIDELEQLVEAGNKDAIFAHEFIHGIHKFSFFDDLNSILSGNGTSLDELLEQKNYTEIFNYVLGEKGLNLARIPKALLHFHNYGDENRTAFEEQVFEGISVFSDIKNNVTIHFTIAEGYEELFKKEESYLSGKYENNNFDISYSVQDHLTHSIALNEQNELYMVDDKPLLHPSGHGALLSNLDRIDADIIHIKNIDNLPRTDKDTQSFLYKKLLVGYLVKCQKQVFYYLDLIENSELSEEVIISTERFVEKELNFVIRDSYKNYSLKLKRSFLLNLLDRPIRVCGMVRNTGEPGGGPFWVKDPEGNINLQIVEQSQITEDQKELLKTATHFNPVDMVCAVRNHKGMKYNLFDFRDNDSYIISKKSYNGDEIKIFENPGLWNGSMAYWNTFFVEVPDSTFAPVKEVNDLLKSVHQPAN